MKVKKYEFFPHTADVLFEGYGKTVENLFENCGLAVESIMVGLDSLDFKIPIIGVAKGAERKKNEIIGKIPKGISEETLISVRDEAHRFAITYHKKLRGREFIK